MRKILCLISLLYSLNAVATISLVQSVANTTCPASGTTCAVSGVQGMVATGTGHLIQVWIFMTTAGVTNTISSVSCGGTFTVDAATNNSDATIGGAQEMAYALISTSGATSCTITTTNAINGGVMVFSEYSTTTSGFAFDTSSARTQTTTTNTAGVTLTLSGSNDVVIQAVSPNGTASAISGTYTSPASFPGGWGYAGSINTASGTAPTWTISSGNDILDAEAFKEISAGGPSGVGYGGKAGIGGKAGLGL